MDAINGCFEFIAGLLLMLNVRRILKDKQVKGVYWFPTAFFALWGFWNLVYYPHLNQWLSFTGGIIVVTANTTWVVLVLWYKSRKG